MIKATELRIGNLIKWSGHIVTVNTGGEIDLMADKAHPIELTLEWLERMGFVKREGETPTLYATIKMDLNIQHSSEGFRLRTENADDYYDCNVGPALQFVHQLQNLFFALSGEELEIKLNT